jgi:hypothetical protein
MFCSKCGKEIQEDAVYCPNCGAEIHNDGKNNTKKSLDEALGSVSKKAKDIGDRINEATYEQREEYTKKATETASDFINDVKQVKSDKNVANFFTKNKYRNSIILAALLVIIIIISNVLSGGSDWTSELPRFHGEDVSIGLKIKELYGSESKYEAAKRSIEDLNFAFMGINSKGGVEYYKAPLTTDDYFGVVNGKAVSVYFKSDNSQYEHYNEDAPLFIEVPNETFMIFGNRVDNAIELCFVNPKKPYSESTIIGYAIVSDKKFNEYTNGNIKVNIIKEKDYSKAVDRINELKNERQQQKNEEIARQKQQIKDELLSKIKIGENTYCDKYNYNIKIAECDGETLLIDFGGNFSVNYQMENIRNTDSGSACDLRGIEAVGDVEVLSLGSGTVIFMEDGIDVSSFIMPDATRLEPYYGEQYIFYYVSEEKTTEDTDSATSNTGGDLISGVYGYWSDDGTIHLLEIDAEEMKFYLDVTRSDGPEAYMEGTLSKTGEGITATVTYDDFDAALGKNFSVTPSSDEIILKSNEEFYYLNDKYPYVGDEYDDLYELQP